MVARSQQIVFGLLLTGAVAALLAVNAGREQPPPRPIHGETPPPAPSRGDVPVPLRSNRTTASKGILSVVHLQTDAPIAGLEIVAMHQRANDGHLYWLQAAMQHERQYGLLGTTDARGTIAVPGEGIYRFATRNSRLLFSPKNQADVRTNVVTRLTVAVGAEIRGSVWTTQGVPAEGAFVAARIASDSGGDTVTPACRVDDGGAFVLHALPPMQEGELWVVHPRHAPRHVRLEPLLPDTSTPLPPIVLDAGFALGVRVFDATTRTPIAGAALELHPEDRGAPLPVYGATTVQGTASFAGLPEGSYRLIACAERYVVAEAAIEVRGDANVEISMNPGVEVTGRVIESGTGIPLAACLAKATFGEVRARAFTDEKGEFRLWTNDGPLRVGFEHEGHVKRSVRATAPARLGDVELDPEGTIRGRVVEQDGTPCRAFRISLTNVDAKARAGSTGRNSIAFGTPDGNFTVARMEKGTYTVEAWSHDGSATTEVGVEVGRAAAVELTLVPHAKLSGLVIDSKNSSPVVGARLRIPLDPLGGFAGIVGDALGAPSASGTVETDGRGEFEIGVPARGAHLLRVQHDGYRSEAVELAEGARRDHLVIRLEPREWVTGKCVDDRGNGIAGIDVALCGADSMLPISTTRSAHDGSFSCGRDRDATAYRLVVSSRTGLWYEARDLDRRQPNGHVFVMPRGGSRITGRIDLAVRNLLVVRVPPEESAPDLRIRPMWPRVMVQGNADGTFDLGGLVAGSLILSWVKEGVQRRKLVMLGSNEAVAVDLD